MRLLKWTCHTLRMAISWAWILKSYFHTGKYIVLDLGFCVLKGIIKLQEIGLFVCTLTYSVRAGLLVSLGM